ncbi:MAG: hypothetical protein II040_08205 [Muribaculaceae bacterium]|nr:hypothetical protein [Muribaculaceae bacterium]
MMLTYSLRSIASITTGYSKARPLGEMAHDGKQRQPPASITTARGPMGEMAHEGKQRQPPASINTVQGPLGEMTRAVYNKNRRPALGRPFYCLLMANR